MSESADLMQFPLSFAFEGKDYPVPIAEFRDELEYTNWLELQARERLARIKTKLGADYPLHLEIWQNGCDAFKYDFAGRISWESRHSETGQKKLCWILLSRLTPTATEDLVDRIFADPDKREELLKAYWRSLARGRPTKQAPAEPDA